MTSYCLILDDEVKLGEATIEYVNALGFPTGYVQMASVTFIFIAEHDSSRILEDINL